MRSPVRLVWRGGTMAVKLDECPRCGQVDRHRIERQVRWLSIGPVGILPIGIRHGIECFTCRELQPLPWSVVWRGIRSGRLPLPGRTRTAAATTVGGDGRPLDLDRLTRSRSLDGATVTVGVWAIVVAILVGLALQPPAKETVSDEHVPWCLKVDGVPLGSPIPTLTTSTVVVQTLCVFPHTYEPIATPEAPFAAGATIPPGPGFGPEVKAACEAAFTRAFGKPAGSTPLWLGQVGPGPKAWAAGTRTVWCVVADPATVWSTSILVPASKP
jgi:hypothetical protein